jgi:serine/threonine-protein kinase
LDPATWREARELFEELVELDEQQRDARLASTAPDTAALVREMLLLDARADERSFLGEEARPLRPAPRHALEGQSIGPFRVLRELGQGGMGVVYEAEQDRPRRRVALKVLRPELVGGGHLRRFQVEAEILASLRHPGIAQVLASGTHVAGEGALRVELHWLALELLEEARPLSSWAAEQALDARACAALVARVVPVQNFVVDRNLCER